MDYIANVTTEVTAFNEKFREAALLEHEKFMAYAQSIPEADLEAEYADN